MGATGLVNKIYDVVTTIDFGRKGFAIKGKADEGCISYETGRALSTFKDAQSTVDPKTIILVETFLNQELQFCDELIRTALSALPKLYRVLMILFLCLMLLMTSMLTNMRIKPIPTVRNTG